MQSGRELTHEGDLAHELFVIEAGTASVSRDGSPVRQLGPGDFFGEIALLDDQPRRTATVVATSPMRLAVPHRRHLRALDRELPGVARRIHDVLAARLADDRAR